MENRVMITGASGLLGRAILVEFRKSKWDVMGLAFSRSGENLRKVDLRNKDEIESIIEEFKPDVVIHAAAERRPDYVEKQEDETTKLNVTATGNIAKATAKNKSFLLYISTDYVFDGKNPPYKPTDDTNPLNKYGESKLNGEREALSYLPNCGVLRIPVLYGPVEHLHESVVTGLFGMIKKKQPCKVSNYEQRYPTCVNDIAVVCRQIAEKRMHDKSFSGIWHWRSNDKLTKYGMIKEMGDTLGMSIEHISADNEPSSGAKRPYDCEFDCSDLEKLNIGQRTPFKDGIKECLAPFLD